MSESANAATSATEQRSDSRQRINDYFRVYDKESGKLIGDLVNLSAGGMMVEAGCEIEPETELVAEIEWSDSSGAANRFSLSAECRWCKPGEASSSFDAGFQFKKKTVLQDTALKMMIANFESRRPYPAGDGS